MTSKHRTTDEELTSRFRRDHNIHIMKALSVKQPFASLIASGQKIVETRKWTTKYRGRILICSSKRPAAAGLNLIDYPLGVAMCTINLVDIREMLKSDEEMACCDYYEDAYAWCLLDVCKVEPIPIRGKLQLFNVDFIDPYVEELI